KDLTRWQHLAFNSKKAAMKLFLVLLFLPLFSASQTVHARDGVIHYGGKEDIEGVSASDIQDRVQHILPSLVNGYKIETQTANELRARGELKLKTPYNIIRVVHYSVEVTSTQNGYEYLIDSVSFTEQRRGEKPETKSSKEVLGNMSEQEPVVGETERLLNQ